MEQNYLSLQLNMRVVQAGHLFSNLFQGYSRKKKICTLVIQELNIIAKNAEVITVMFLMMVQNLLENDIATMVGIPAKAVKLENKGSFRPYGVDDKVKDE